MSWLKWTIIVTGLGMLLLSASKPVPAKSRSGARRQKRTEPAEDKVKAALASATLDDMLAAVGYAPADPMDRHLLLTGIVSKTYPNRHNDQMKNVFFTHARIYVDEFPRYVAGQGSESADTFMVTPVFKMLAIALADEGNYTEAIAVCRRALEYGLDDGTRTGFAGRIQRLEKLQNK